MLLSVESVNSTNYLTVKKWPPQILISAKLKLPTYINSKLWQETQNGASPSPLYPLRRRYLVHDRRPRAATMHRSSALIHASFVRSAMEPYHSRGCQFRHARERVCREGSPGLSHSPWWKQQGSAKLSHREKKCPLTVQHRRPTEESLGIFKPRLAERPRH